MSAPHSVRHHSRAAAPFWLPLALLGLACAPPAWSDGGSPSGPALRSITDNSLRLPTLRQIARVITLSDYNTRVVIIGVSLLGATSGMIGSFLLLRKRALIGDALSHATLPGIGLAFLVATALGGSGKSLPLLLLGGTVTGVLGVVTILAIVHLTRVKEDAALGIVLSVFFAAGVSILGVIQNLSSGHAAGLSSFIYGKTASMMFSDALLIAVAAGLVALTCVLLLKEFTLLCFDTSFAAAQGWPVVALDMVLMATIVIVTVIGLQAVGLILMVALLVIPAAAARFWTHHLPSMLLAAAGIGAVSGCAGAAVSALTPRMPAGAIIVIVAGLFFTASMLFGPAGGMMARWSAHRRLSRRVGRQHLLRAFFELAEPHHAAAPRAIALEALLAVRSWSAGELRRLIRRAARDGVVQPAATRDAWLLTPEGAAAAWRVTRNHRLWELYLITHADVAPSHVDRDADAVEHVLDPAMIAELEALLARDAPLLVQPPSPHGLSPAPAAHGAA
ncbi:MAG: hypothetical protein CHACPFDD_02197 [Phycisphaerae bacterium]|nr:hypothetical protein [Phycisphaerae bacterium]